jgi:hypothetical protein
MYEGSSSDADTFATLLAGRVRVEILKQQK